MTPTGRVHLCLITQATVFTALATALLATMSSAAGAAEDVKSSAKFTVRPADQSDMKAKGTFKPG